LREFELDNDIQYIKIMSTNVGMIRTYQKRYKKKWVEQAIAGEEGEQ
jgi:hypothetical protein